MTETLTVTEAARHFADYLNRVAYRRESFVLARGNKKLAELRPLPACGRLGDLPSLVASLPHLSSEDAADFGRDLDEARESMRRVEVRDAWGS